jgi:hypothetical protein
MLSKKTALVLVVDELARAPRGCHLGEAHLDALARQHVGEQGVGAAVELRHGDDVVAGLGQVQDRVVDGGAARR